MPGIAVSQQIHSLATRGEIIFGEKPLSNQIQPASLDLRLGSTAHEARSGFLVENHTVEERLAQLRVQDLDLTNGAVLEKNRVYIIPLQESLNLSPTTRARSNPKSSTGRLDIFTRLLTDRNSRFDDVAPGYTGPLYLEVAPRSFHIRIKASQTLNQIRFFQGDAALTDDDLLAAYKKTPMVFGDAGPLPLDQIQTNGEGGFFLRIGLEGSGMVGYMAKRTDKIVDLEKIGEHNPAEYWTPVTAKKGQIFIHPEEFYIFASKEKIAVPPDFAAEMLPYDVGIGELRTNYAGFFDNGFGWKRRGTRAVLEVRAHDVPFLVEDGQVFFRLNYFRTLETPSFLYGDPQAGSSYAEQGLTLAKQFRAP